MKQDALVMVLERNLFYKRQYRLALGALLLNMTMIFVSAVAIYVLLMRPVHSLYFAADNFGRLMPIVPIGQPNMTTKEVEAWVEAAVENIYSYNYVNYRSQLQSSQKYFTEYGWNKYITALTASNNLLALSQRKLVVLAKVIEPPKVLAEGLLSGSYAWQFRLSILLNYLQPPYDDQSKYSNILDVKLIVQRQSMLHSDSGLGIVQIIGDLVTTAFQPNEISEVPTT